MSSWIPSANDRRLERRRVDLALGEDPDEGRRERRVLREHQVLALDPVGLVVLVVIEGDDLDPGTPGHVGELAEPVGVHGLDHDEPGDRVGIDPPGVGHVELVRVQPVEVADVPVQRAGERDDRAREQAARGQHRGERVEVGVRVRGDDVHELKVRPEPGPACSRGRVPAERAEIRGRTGTASSHFARHLRAFQEYAVA